MGRRSRTKTRTADQPVSQGAHGAAAGTAARRQLHASGARGVRLTSARANLLLAAAVGALHLTLALATYFPGPHTGGDNASYITLGYSLLHDGAYRELWDPAEPPHTKYPPVFPFILATAMAAGAQTWGALKLVIILFTTLAAAFTYLWVAERSGRLLALGVSTLFAASASLVYASHWVLSEAPFVALTLCAVWACERAERRGFPTPWVLLGAAATILAYFTRSAGLPLVLALVAWLALRRRWRAAASAGAAFTVLATAWWWRGRAGSAPSYVAEFWMRNPYQPELGTVNALDLVGRVIQNTWLYTKEFVPAGVIGQRGLAVTVGGVVLVGLALWGWVWRARRGAGLPELLLPLYLGLILLWPTVWSGDRFALPVLPLLIFYAAEPLVQSRVIARRAALIGALAFLLAAVPLSAHLRQQAQISRTCLELTRASGPFGCYGGPVQEFAAAAQWSGAHLPAAAAVFSRKPSIFYVLSGIHSRVFPLTDDPQVFGAAVREAGVRYVIIDYLDQLGGRYLMPVIQKVPDAFCYVSGFGDREGQTLVLGILPERLVGSGQGNEAEREPSTLSIASCDPAMQRAAPQDVPSSSASTIPLLVREEP